MPNIRKTIDRLYSVEDYNSDWVVQFDIIRKNIEFIFKDQILKVEHVGSTSIPGIKGKPLIDVLVLVDKMEPFLIEKEKMAELGYQRFDNYLESNSILFFKEEAGHKKTENVHFCLQNSPKAIQLLQTRDYLRAHPDRAEAYGNLKKQLYEQYSDNYPAYRAGKQAFLDETERLTYEWAKGNIN